MNINKYINVSKEDIFHSNGFARVAVNSLGSTSTESFARRRHINRNRRAVQNYGDSMIGRGHMRETARTDLEADNPLRQKEQPDLPVSRQQPVRGPAKIKSSIPQRAFKEPPTRGFNPYS